MLSNIMTQRSNIPKGMTSLFWGNLFTTVKQEQLPSRTSFINCACVCTYVCACTCVCVCTDMCMHICTCSLLCMCICVCLCACVCVSVHLSPNYQLWDVTSTLETTPHGQLPNTGKACLHDHQEVSLSEGKHVLHFILLG